MVGTISVKVQAHNPSFPLEPVYTFVNSAQSFRILNVPKKIGKWDITHVYVNVSYPDQTIVAKECVINGSVWVGTVSGCATSGTCTNGFVVTASGVDEDGNTVSNYVLGAGDLYVQQLDGTIAPETHAAKMYFYEDVPIEPKIGDAAFISEILNVWNGHVWRPAADAHGDYIEDGDGNRIDANGDFTYLVPNTWGLFAGDYGNHLLMPRPITDDYWECIDEENGQKFILMLGEFRDSWTLTYSSYDPAEQIWVQYGSGTSYDSEYATSLEINMQMDGGSTVTWHLNKPGQKTERLATVESIPTKTSQLSNDSGFITANDVNHIQDLSGNVISANRSVVVAVDPYWLVDDEYAMTGRKDYSTLIVENQLLTLVWSEDVFEGWKLASFTRTSPSDNWTTQWVEVIEGSESDTQLTFPEHNVSVELITNETRNDKLALTSELVRVNNPTVQLTQGGVLKGSFTLNQSNNTTINVDAVPTNTVTLSGTYTDQTTFSYTVYTT